MAKKKEDEDDDDFNGVIMDAKEGGGVKLGKDYFKGKFRREKKKIEEEKREEYNKTELLIAIHDYQFTESQWKFLIKNVPNCKDILKLTRDCYEEQDLTTDSDEYDNIRKYAVRVQKKQFAYSFTESELEYLQDRGETMSATEMCRNLFPDETTVGKQAQTASKLLKIWGLEISNPETPEFISSAYQPPSTEHAIIKAVNRADSDAKFQLAKLGVDRKMKERILFLKKVLNTDRFIAMASAMKTKTLRRIFEAEFIKSVYDKTDLLSEEINGWMDLSNEYVLSVMNLEEQAVLNERLNEAATDDAEGRAFTKNLSDSLIAKSSDYDRIQKRKAALRDELVGRRSKRQENAVGLRESLAKFVEYFRAEDKREQSIRIKEARDLELKEEVDKIKGFDDLIAEVHGMSIDEIINN